MYKTTISILTFSLLTSASAVWAAGEMKPGLWEMSAKLTAEQLAQIPKGTTVPGLVGDTVTVKTCITPKEAENLGLVDDEQDDYCKISNKKSVGTTYTADTTCTGSIKNGTGKSKTVFKDSGNFTAVLDFTGTLYGNKVVEHNESTGKWISSDCGSVK